jgi:hypothetical protein
MGRSKFWFLFPRTESLLKTNYDYPSKNLVRHIRSKLQIDQIQL